MEYEEKLWTDVPEDKTQRKKEHGIHKVWDRNTGVFPQTRQELSQTELAYGQLEIPPFHRDPNDQLQEA